MRAYTHTHTHTHTHARTHPHPPTQDAGDTQIVYQRMLVLTVADTARSPVSLEALLEACTYSDTKSDAPSIAASVSHFGFQVEAKPQAFPFHVSPLHCRIEPHRSRGPVRQLKSCRFLLSRHPTRGTAGMQCMHPRPIPIPTRTLVFRFQEHFHAVQVEGLERTVTDDTGSQVCAWLGMLVMFHTVMFRVQGSGV